MRGSFSARSRRERVAIIAGALALLVALVATLLPASDRWREREDAIAARRARLSRIRDLAASETGLRSAAASVSLDDAPRALGGRTPALAAAELQTLLQQYAEKSRVTVTRLDVTNTAQTADSATSVPLIPATLSAIGDIHGVAQLLDEINRGPRVLDVTDLSIVQNAVFKGGLLQFTVSVRGPWIERP